MAEEVKHLLSCPVVSLGEILDIIEIHGHVLVEDFQHSREALPDVLGAEGDAGVAERTRVGEALLKRGQLGLVLLHHYAGLPEEETHHGQGSDHTDGDSQNLLTRNK